MNERKIVSVYFCKSQAQEAMELNLKFENLTYSVPNTCSKGGKKIKDFFFLGHLKESFNRRKSDFKWN